MPNIDVDFNRGLITNVCGGGLFTSLHSYLSGCNDSIYIIVPFISISTIEKLLSFDIDKKVSIVTSWRPDHLRSGVSSLDLYLLCKRKGWTLYINSRIHCKIYSDSFNSCVITSANCTERALCSEEGNIECCTLINNLKPGSRFELNKIVAGSTLVDDRIYEQYFEWFNTQNSDDNYNPIELETDNITLFYTFQLPACESPYILWDYICNPENYLETLDIIEHDLSIYSTNPFLFKSKNEFIEDVRSVFINHPFIKKIDEIIDEKGIRFGTFKAFIHQICSDVPLPYRSEITVLVQNLYNWFVELFPEEYYWDIPGSHSQVMYRRGRSIK